MGKSKTSVYLYVPNIISYIRIILLILAIICFNISPTIAIVTLITSGILDACDGTLARLLNQVSRLGTMLDYATDRISLTIGMGMLIVRVPKFWFIWISVLSIDLFSHFCHLYLTAFTNNQNHKEISSIKSRVLSLYYNSRPVLFCTCLFHDLFFTCILVYSFIASNWIICLALILWPWVIFKTLIHILQIIGATKYSITLEQK